MKLLLVAAAALIDAERRVLITRRPPGKTLAGLWEFPGGKLEPGESPEAALERELAEELDVIVATKDLSPLAFASHGYPEFHLLMPLFVCRRWRGAAAPTEGQEARWVFARELHRYDMPPADGPLIGPLTNYLA